jgi:tetratricopeptide (TPR) repeat protein/predicted Ser/Thr protein kinase
MRPAGSTITQPYLTPPDYEVLEVLGRGGMGIVYRAKQPGLNRVVALKMILAGRHATDEERSRFQAEAEAVGAIRHPGIVQVYQSGTHQELPFLAMELCPGGSLSDRLRGTPLAAAEAARLVEALARAMQHAHENGIVHRDLKPANVLLDEKGEPKITDFGLAKRLQHEDVTVAGTFMGTPSYVPPEQARGEKVGPLADVYSLGATLYECLTGHPPFRAATRDETIRQLLDNEPVSVRTLQPRTPRDLETICHKCLQKEPEKRYASAQDLADDLDRFLKHEPILARPVGALERAVKWVRRKPTLAGLWLAIVLLLAIMLGSWIAMTVRLRREREEAQRQRDVARDEAAKADWFRELMAAELEDPFGNEGGLYRIAPELGERQTFAEALERARLKARLRLKCSPLIYAAVLDAVGSAYVTLGQHARAKECLDESLALREDEKATHPLDYARGLHSMGKFHHERGRIEHDDYNEARSYYERSLAITQERMADPAFCAQAISTRFLMAWLLSEEQRFDEALAGFAEVQRLVERHVESAGTFDEERDAHHLRQVRRLQALARVGAASIKVESAPTMRTLAFLEAMKGYLAAMREMVAYDQDSDLMEAYALFEEGARALLVYYDPRVDGEQKRRSVEKAIATLTRCRNSLAAAKGRNQLYYALGLLFLGEAYLSRGQPKEAAEQLAASLDVVRRSVGLQHHKALYVARQYASALRRTGREADGRAVQDEVVRAAGGRYGENHPAFASALGARGSYLVECGRHGEAEADLRRALAIWGRHGGPRRLYYQRCAEELCDVLRRQGKHEEAAKVQAARTTP